MAWVGSKQQCTSDLCQLNTLVSHDETSDQNRSIGKRLLGNSPSSTSFELSSDSVNTYLATEISTEYNILELCYRK